VSRYVLTSLALRDLEEILARISKDSSSVAVRVSRRSESTFDALSRNPGMGHVRGDLTVRPVRFWPVYSYLIVYAENTTPLQIIRVLSGYRDLAALLRKTTPPDTPARPE
jgi:plasmid stabilization system protein ParE